MVVANDDGDTWVLKWEGVYNQYSQVNGPVPTDQWVSENLVDANFWRSPLTQNGNWVGFSGCNQAGDPYGCLKYDRHLSDGWLEGYRVVRVEVSAGSGWDGSFLSYVDNVTVNDTAYDFTQDAVVDTEAPDVTITSPASGAVLNTNVTLAGTITDNTELLRYYYVVKDSSGVKMLEKTVYSDDTSVDFSKTVDVSSWADGLYTFQLEARDAVGNKDAGSIARVLFTVDTTPTATSKDSCKANGWRALYTVDNRTFKNQGQCIAYVESSENS